MDFESMSFAELKELAKEKGVKNISKFKKDDVIAILKDITFEETDTTQEQQSSFKEITTPLNPPSLTSMLEPFPIK